MYPRESVARFVTENFLPVRIHVREQPAALERFGAQWTPTIMILDSQGSERHRIEGFLPENDFLAQLTLGLGHLAFAEKRWADAERHFQEVLDRFPDSDTAAEAQYWRGVARYKASGDAVTLKETAAAFTERYQDSPWAKKASVWEA